MVYTVNKLAKISGVSIRTLHFYDEIGLLNPAYHGNNGYRYYQEEQLLMLQQILFFRELGLELKQIQKILKRSDFDKMEALVKHKGILQKEVVRTQQLIETIEKTIKHLKGETPMQDQEMYLGFSREKQAEYEKYLKNRLGEDNPSFAECEKNVKNWTKEDWGKYHQESDENFKELAKLMEKQLPVDSFDVQAIVFKHYKWLKRLWTPNKESYTGLGKMYTEFEWKKAFEAYDSNHPRLAMYLAEAMAVFAERELE